MIGDAEKRFREDRSACCARYGLRPTRPRIEGRTRAPIRRLAGLLASVPPSRLLDEMLKLLLSGHAVQGVTQLRKEGLHHGVLPLLDVIMEQPLGERFVMLALKSTDERILAGKPVSPGFLFAALLWHEVLAAWKDYEAKGEHQIPALHRAMERVLQAQREKLAITHRFSADMMEIWALQPRFLQRYGKRPWRLLEHLRFRAAYDFFRLRCENGEVPREIGEWWSRFQYAGETSASNAGARTGSGRNAPQARRRRRGGADRAGITTGE